jgi:hypothetical protein
MPNVNVKYQLTLDATVTFNHLDFEGTTVSPSNTTGGDNLPTDIIFVDNEIGIKLLMSGSEGSWTIAVSVIALDDDNNQTGKWIPCAANGTSTFTDDVSKMNLLDGEFLISWT